MKFNRLGNSGLKVSQICLGTMTFGSRSWKPWALEEEDSRPIIRHAVEQGVNFFDTADIYSNGRSEEILGAAIRDYSHRQEAVIATKVFLPQAAGPNRSGLSRKHLLHAVEGSLQRLKTDYIDLYILHRWDYETPLDETLATLAGIIMAGKVRYVGVSSMFAWQLAKANLLAERDYGFRFISMQNHYNLVYREEEREMLPLCQDSGIGITPYSPLARGYLSRSPDGKQSARAQTDEFTAAMYDTPENREVVTRVHRVAERLSVKASQVALAWLKSKRAVSSIVLGASMQAHISAAIAALDIELTEQDIAYLQDPYRPRPVIGHS